MAETSVVYYCGCDNDRVGHYTVPNVRDAQAERPTFELDNPDRWDVVSAHEHERKLHHVNGWTVLSMRDNTVDTRPGSHMTFAMAGTLTLEDAESKARAAFPRIWQRVDAKKGVALSAGLHTKEEAP